MWCPGCRRGTKRGLAAHSLKWQKHTATHFLRLEILSFLWAPSLPSFFIPHHNLIISSFFSLTCYFHYTNKSWTQHLPKCTTDSCTLMDKPRSSNDIFLSFTSVVGFFITKTNKQKNYETFLFLLSQQQITDSLLRVGDKICSFLLTDKTELWHVVIGWVIRVQV